MTKIAFRPIPAGLCLAWLYTYIPIPMTPNPLTRRQGMQSSCLRANIEGWGGEFDDIFNVQAGRRLEDKVADMKTKVLGYNF